MTPSAAPARLRRRFCIGQFDREIAGVTDARTIRNNPIFPVFSRIAEQWRKVRFAWNFTSESLFQD